MIKGLWRHFLLTLRLNFRSGRAIVYGYIMPILFLVGFGTVFRTGEPRLLYEIGQIFTITILGSACLGMPTALVAERDKGVWRRYQLLPVPINALLSGVLLVRVILAGTAVCLQIVLAHSIYGTPLPSFPFAFALAFTVVTFAFMGVGLILTSLAKDVPSVQALGQCVFLPMILIGGVGVPLYALPDWCRQIASFMPGRYAVELLQSAYQKSTMSSFAVYPALILILMGVAAYIAGLRLLDWEQSRPKGRRIRSALWIALALASWIGAGITTLRLDRISPLQLANHPSFLSIDQASIESITYDGLPDDHGIYTPLAPPLNTDQRMTHRMREFAPRLRQWDPGLKGDTGQRVRNLISVAAVADITQDNSEAIIARQIYDFLQASFDKKDLTHALAWIVLSPDNGSVVSAAPELGLKGEAHPDIIRERSAWYARKFLGRILGHIPDPPP